MATNNRPDRPEPDDRFDDRTSDERPTYITPRHRRSVARCSLDLRVTQTRHIIDKLMERAAGLDAKDRDLLRAIYVSGHTVASLARIRNQRASSLRKYIKQLVKRIQSRDYVFVVAHRSKWSPTRRAVAVACIIQSRSFRDAAALLHISIHSVRNHHNAILALAAEAHAEPITLELRQPAGVETQRAQSSQREPK